MFLAHRFGLSRSYHYRNADGYAVEFFPSYMQKERAKNLCPYIPMMLREAAQPADSAGSCFIYHIRSFVSEINLIALRSASWFSYISFCSTIHCVDVALRTTTICLSAAGSVSNI